MLAILPFLAYQDLQVDPLLLVKAQEVWSVIARPDNPVWPGWDASQTPILIYFPNRQELLINHPNPPEGFQPYTGSLKSTIGPIFVKDGATMTEFDGQNTAIDVNGVRTLMVADTLSARRQWAIGLAGAITANPNDASRTVENSLFPNPYNILTLFAHEAFHVYQHAKAPNKGGNELALLKYPSLSVENNVGFALEADLLKSAIEAPTIEATRAASLQWLAVRQWRRSFLSPEAAEYEDGTEFNEGTGKYVEFRLLQALEGLEPSPEMWYVQGFRGYGDLSVQREGLIRQMTGFMNGSRGVNNDLYGASPVRFRLYYSGMGIGAMLDKLKLNWHDAIFRPDTTMTSLAEEALRPSATEIDDALQLVKAKPEFTQFMQEKEKLAADGKAYTDSEVAKFDTAAGELVLDYSGLENAQAGFSFTPFGILRVDDNRTIFRLIPIRGSINQFTFSEDGPRPVLQDTRLRQIRFTLTSAPELSAIRSQLGGEDSIGRSVTVASLQLPGVLLENLRGTVTVDGRRVVVKLTE